MSVVIVILALSSVASAVHGPDDDPLQWLRDSIPGEPGVDYPIFSAVEDTEFSCRDRIFGGYYADVDMGCQGFHVCLGRDSGSDNKVSFICPNGTIFNQAIVTCDWWFNVDCTEAEANYGVNENLGVIPPPNEDYDDDGFSRDRGRRRQRLFSEEEEQPRSGIRQQQINAQETEYEDEYDYGDDDIFVEYDDDNDYGDEDLDAFIRENLEEEEYTEEEEPVHDVIKQLEDAVREVEQEEQVRSDADDDDDEVRQRPQQKSNNGRRAQFNINGRRRKNKNNNRRRPTTTTTTTSTTTPASSSSSQGIHAGTAASAISGGNSLDGGILDPPVTTLRPRLATLQLEPNQSFQESRQEPPPGFEEVLRANVDHQEEDTSTTTEFKRPRQERKQNERRRRKKKNKRRRKQQQQQQQNQQQFRVRDPLSSPDQIVDIVHYDATLPDGISDDYNDGVPLLFADPFVEVREPDSPNRLYDAPPLGRKR